MSQYSRGKTKLNIAFIVIKQWFTEQIAISLNKFNYNENVLPINYREPFYIAIRLHLTESKMTLNYYLFVTIIINAQLKQI